MVSAHIFSYQLRHGATDLELDHRHTCPKNCVNPDHLRPVPHKQNGENRSGANSNNRSCGIRGVTWHGQAGKWRVQVRHAGRSWSGGLFDDLAEAEAAAIALRNRLFTHNDADRQ